jgi:homoserine kinase
MSKPTVKRASVRVPASTSNLGAGFDFVGMAVDRWLRVSVELREDSRDDAGLVTIRRTGTLRALDDAGLSDVRRDLIYVGFNEVSRARDGKDGFHGAIHFEADSDIPIGKGLGSSAAALLAGAALANETLGLGLSLEALAQGCAGVEGHGDNVAAAALGGAVLVTPGWPCPVFSPLPVHESLGFAFAVPDFETRTELARAVLPTHVTFRTAVAAAARAASLVQGLSTGNRRQVTAGLADVLHVEHRKPLVAHYERVTAAARTAGAIGATLSGSGSSIVAVAPREIAAQVAAEMADAWREVGIQADAFAARVCLAGLSVSSPTHRLTDSPTHLPRNISCP